jgi:hypothetical protein
MGMEIPMRDSIGVSFQTVRSSCFKIKSFKALNTLLVKNASRPVSWNGLVMWLLAAIPEKVVKL